MKPGARLTNPSVARISKSINRCWFAGSTVNTLIRTIMSSSEPSDMARLIPLGHRTVQATLRHRAPRAVAGGVRRPRVLARRRVAPAIAFRGRELAEHRGRDGGPPLRDALLRRLLRAL